MHVYAASLAPDWSVRKATSSDNTERTPRSGAVHGWDNILSRPRRTQCRGGGLALIYLTHVTCEESLPRHIALLPPNVLSLRLTWKLLSFGDSYESIVSAKTLQIVPPVTAWRPVSPTLYSSLLQKRHYFAVPIFQSRDRHTHPFQPCNRLQQRDCSVGSPPKAQVVLLHRRH